VRGLGLSLPRERKIMRQRRLRKTCEKLPRFRTHDISIGSAKGANSVFGDASAHGSAVVIEPRDTRTARGRAIPLGILVALPIIAVMPTHRHQGHDSAGSSPSGRGSRCPSGPQPGAFHRPMPAAQPATPAEHDATGRIRLREGLAVTAGRPRGQG